MNTRGDVLLMGTQGCSINQQRLDSTSSGGRWLTDDSVIYQTGPPFGLESCDWPSRLTRTVAPRGANEIKAAGGHWAAYLANDGVRTSWGLHLPQSGLVALAEDRTLAIVDATTGVNLRLVLANGAIVPLGGNAIGMVLLDEHTAIWNDYKGQLHARGLPIPAVPGFVHAVLDVQGTPWILSTSQDRLLLHPLTSTQGYQVATGQHLYGPCAAVVDGGRITIAWSYGAGEEPSDLRTTWIDPVSPRVDLLASSVTSPPAPLPSTIAQVGRPAIWAYWKAVDLLAPCNTVVIERDADLALTQTGRPLIILRPMLPSCWQYWDRVLAVLIHEEGGQAKVEAQARLAILAMQAAGVPKRDVMTYTGKTLHPSAKGVDIHGIQAYLAPDTPNPAAAMAKRIRADAAQFGPKQRMVLHGMAYDQRTYNDSTRKPANTAEGWTDVKGLKALQTVYPACVKADSRFVGCLWFHDGQRQGGTRDYPELIPYHARCVAVTPGPPAIPVIVPPPPDPDPPVDDEEEPPVPTPVKFPPMSDAERAEVATMIETIYDTIYPDRAQRQTRVDTLGYGRWPVDYLVARARGSDHAGGIKTMRAALFSAAGVPDPDPQ